MSVDCFVEDADGRPAQRLIGIYVRVMMWYLLGVAALWLAGLEGIYGCPTPFYALWYPAFDSIVVPAPVVIVVGLVGLVAARRLYRRALPRQALAWGIWTFLVLLVAYALFQEVRHKDLSLIAASANYWRQVRWHLLAGGVFLAFFGGAFAALRRQRWFEEEPSRRFVGWGLVGLVFFAFMFSGAVAMIRNGPDGISQAYTRFTYEAIGDIGLGRSIRGLFQDYLNFHPYLSLHSRVHPPGSIALLWLLSYVAGRDPMGLSLATMVVGSLAVIPLYLWASDLTNRRAALTCCALYVLMPSITLFTATSVDIAFTPFSIAALFLFGRALSRRSAIYGLAAGASYAWISLLHFSLLILGAYFIFMGLRRLRQTRRWVAVFQTAVLMAVAFLAVHWAVYAWSGFDVVACFRACKAAIGHDRASEAIIAPRFSALAWRLLNPVCWFFFAGIPASVLFFRRLRRPDPAAKPLFIAFALTLVVLTLLYLGKGEGERSAMYILPFVALPAAHLLDQIGRGARSYGPLAATLGFLGFQCWLIESCLYTFW
jgi:hypothetical protein